MTDSTVVFQQDGSHMRAGDINPMDVSQKKEENVQSTQVKSTIDTGATSAPAKPGTFSLSALKASVARATSAQAQSTEGAAPSDVTKEKQQVSAPAKNDTVASTIQGEATTVAQNTPLADTASTGAVEAVAEKLSEENVSSGSAVAVESLNLKATTEVVAVEASPAKKVLDEISDSDESVSDSSIAGENVAAVPSSSESVQSISQSVDREVATTTGADTSSEMQSADATVAASTGIQRMNLSSLQAVVSSEKEKVSVSEALSAKVDDTGVETFRILSLEEFLGIISAGRTEVSHWLLKCIKQAATAPAVIFSAGFNQYIRFYNYFPAARGTAGVIIGAQDAITCAKIDLKNGNISDFSKSIKTEGTVVRYDNGDVVALYSERLRKDMRV